VAQVRGEPRQPGLDVEPGAVPIQQCVHGEAMAQVVEARPAGPGAEAGGADQAQEGEVDVLVVKTGAGSGDEEARAARGAEGAISEPTVRGQRGARGGMERHQAGLAEFGVADPQDTGDGITVRLIQCEGFADPEPGGGQQAEEGAVGRALERGERGERGVQQRPHVRIRVKVRGAARACVGQQRGGRDFGPRVHGAHVRGEAAHEAQSGGGPPRRAPRGLRGPREGQLRGDERGPGLVDEGDEPGQQPAGPLELVAERAAHLQVLAEQGREARHSAPAGQGRASNPSRAVSTFA